MRPANAPVQADRRIVCPGCGDTCIYRYCADRAVNAAWQENDRDPITRKRRDGVFLDAFREHRERFGTYVEGPGLPVFGLENPFPKVTP